MHTQAVFNFLLEEDDKLLDKVIADPKYKQRVKNLYWKRV